MLLRPRPAETQAAANDDTPSQPESGNDDAAPALPDNVIAFFSGAVSTPRRHREYQPDVIEVLERNWAAVQCFGECAQQTIGGDFNPLRYLGLEANEIAAAMWIHQVPRALRADTSRRMRYLAQVTASILNSRDR